MYHRIIIFLFTTILFIPLVYPVSAFDVDTFIANFENKNDQTVLTGQIDSLTIIRGNAEFHLGRGELTLLDFGWDRPAALIFRGEAHFAYEPNDNIERHQLKRFTGKDRFDKNLDSLCIFYNDEYLLDINYDSFVRSPIDDYRWDKFHSAQDHAFSHLGIYLPNKLLGNLLTDSSPYYFYADFYVKNMGRYAYRVDPCEADIHCLYKMIMQDGRETFDVLNCYTDDNWLVSERGILAVDITDYDIESFISSNGDMHVKCRIYYSTLLPGAKFLYFRWFKKNKVVSAVDSNGDSLVFIEKHEPFNLLVNQHMESGFGLVLNCPLPAESTDYIDIEYECNSLYNSLGFFYVSGNTAWYPMNIVRDPAVFHLTYNRPAKYRVVSSGDKLGDAFTPTGVKSVWYLSYPSCNISFNIGKYINMELFFGDLPPIEVFTNVPVHIPQVGADMVNSLAYFTDLFGACPFDTIRVADTPGGYTGSSPGLENFYWEDLIKSTTQGPKRIANQWWIHTLRHESYKDAWITEGLSNYCSFMYFEKSSQRDLVGDRFMKDWRKTIFYGQGAGSKGAEAGPVILGRRLNSSKSQDYRAIVEFKSAYIFHMIRYMLHDYKTGSDSLFIGILRSLLESFLDKPVSTEKLQTLLETYLGDMSWFFDQWVYGTDIPEYLFSYDTEPLPEDKYRVICHTGQTGVPPGFKMTVPLTIHFDNKLQTTIVLNIDQPRQDISLPLLPMKPKKIDFNTYDAVLCEVKYK